MTAERKDHGSPSGELRALIWASIGQQGVTDAHLARLKSLHSKLTRAPLDATVEASAMQAVREAQTALAACGNTHDVSRVIEILTERLSATNHSSKNATAEVAERAKGHLDDADLYRRTSRTYAIAAVLLAGLAGFAIFWGASIASSPGNPPVWALAFPAIGAVVASGGLYMMLRCARQSTLAAREQRRVARAMEDLEGYLAPLPEPTQHLMRAKLAPLLFPRLLEDDDPLRAVQWPTDEFIYGTLSGYEDVSGPQDSRPE